MSIIYDALQKTQKTRELQHSTPLMQKIHHNRILLFRIVLFFVLLAIVAEISLHATAIMHAIHPPKKVVIVRAPAPKPIALPTIRLVLNGVFLSDKEKIAMINQQMFHVGDIIGGMQIVDIEMDTVKLAAQNQTLLLSVQA